MELESFKDFHRGETAAILGGGVTLPKDLRQINPVDVLIGINNHSMILDLDYLVFMDAMFLDLIADLDDVVFITKKHKMPGRKSIQAGIAPPVGYSGLLAIWVADYMGFDRIDVCGMDQYQTRKGGRQYWWEGPMGVATNPPKTHKSNLEPLKSFLDDKLRHPERVFFASGRLKEIHQ